MQHSVKMHGKIALVLLFVWKWQIYSKLTLHSYAIRMKQINATLVMLIYFLRGFVISLRTTREKRESFGVHFYQKDPKTVKIWLSYGNFPLRGCVISLRTIWDERGVLCLYLYQKDPKYVKKWHSCGYLFSERLCDFIEKHMGEKGIPWCSFVTKRSKIRQEMAE